MNRVVSSHLLIVNQIVCVNSLICNNRIGDPAVHLSKSHLLITNVMWVNIVSAINFHILSLINILVFQFIFSYTKVELSRFYFDKNFSKENARLVELWTVPIPAASFTISGYINS